MKTHSILGKEIICKGCNKSESELEAQGIAMVIPLSTCNHCVLKEKEKKDEEVTKEPPPHQTNIVVEEPYLPHEALRGSIIWPALDIPGVRISFVGREDKQQDAWVAEAAGYVAQARSLPSALRTLADTIEGTERLMMEEGHPPAWWTQLSSVFWKDHE